MAEPMSSNEIEDVLSSIRRLVAQDLKPSDRAKLAAVADTAQKLVLAPSQRIEDEPPAEDARFVTVRRPSRKAVFPPVDTVLEGVSAVTARGHDAQPVAADWALGVQAAQRRAEFDAAVPDYSPLGDTPPDYPRMAWDMPAEDPAAQAAQPWQSDFIAPPASSDDEPELGDDFSIDPNARLFDVAPDAFGADHAPQAAAWPAQESVRDDRDFVSAPEAPPESLQGTIEPDPKWADDAEARVIAELAGEAVADEVFDRAQNTFREPNFSAAPPLNSAQGAEVLFDEDQLRAMVQAIFREEMAGPMGERMTRNIRKLVRAEVGRMLAAHELE
jgi:hypothetical protein